MDGRSYNPSGFKARPKASNKVIEGFCGMRGAVATTSEKGMSSQIYGATPSNHSKSPFFSVNRIQ
ncbi:hypothetical protein ABBQ32_011316 [Trebouxia sp. C0010 RCD-2024]